MKDSDVRIIKVRAHLGELEKLAKTGLYAVHWPILPEDLALVPESEYLAWFYNRWTDKAT